MDLYEKFKIEIFSSLHSNNLPAVLSNYIFTFCESHFQNIANVETIRKIFKDGSCTVHLTELPFLISIESLLSITRPIWNTQFSHYCCNKTGIMFFHENDDTPYMGTSRKLFRAWKTKRKQYDSYVV